MAIQGSTAYLTGVPTGNYARARHVHECDGREQEARRAAILQGFHAGSGAHPCTQPLHCRLFSPESQWQSRGEWHPCTTMLSVTCTVWASQSPGWVIAAKTPGPGVLVVPRGLLGEAKLKATAQVRLVYLGLCPDP